MERDNRQADLHPGRGRRRRRGVQPERQRAGAAGGFGQDSVYFWNAVTGQREADVGDAHEPITDVVFSPDSQTLVTLQNSGYRDEVYLWSLGTKRISATITSPDDSAVQSVTFSPDGKMIAIGCLNGKTSLRDIATRKVLATFTDPSSSGVTTATFSPDGKTLATSGTNGSAYLWRIR